MMPSVPVDLSSTRRLHVVGVGGPGMSAIAIVLAEMGHDVSGSDIRERPVLDRVRAAGVRIGAVFSYGAFLTSGELPAGAAPGDRTLTMAGIEGEYAVGHTKVSGEMLHDSFTLPGQTVGATEWFLQATETLTPRWFLSGRHEGSTSPVVGSGSSFAVQPSTYTNEVTVGYRATRDITVKAGYFARQPYGRLDWDHQATVQAVFQHRWW